MVSDTVSFAHGYSNMNLNLRVPKSEEYAVYNSMVMTRAGARNT